MNDILQLAEQLERYNQAYRSGEPLISDAEYDRLVEKLTSLDPGHPLLDRVEPEVFASRREIRHPVPMLSIEKAYDNDQLERFLKRVGKEAALIGVPDIQYRVTVKLDGLAGRDDGDTFATRGNGQVGYEISSAFDKGVIPVGGRGLGLGEIVIVKSYFDEQLADKFEHPRNMVVGIISSDTLNENAKAALKDRVVRFVPYAMLSAWTGSGEELLQNKDEIVADLINNTDYPVDGVVVEVTNESIRNHMGATAHHYRWQIAIKSRGETATTRVEDISWQVGRTGNVTPVLMVRPVFLSGATIRRVTAHHAGLIRDKKIGQGAEIEIIRSGEVIPKLERVIKASEQFVLPENCPSCDTELRWQNDFLKCDNLHCPAQIVQGLSHWFRTLGSADWFGIKTIEKLVESGFDSLEKVYAITEDQFQALGFGPVQSKNLADALQISIDKPVEDWRFLAAFGIPNLGTGDSRKILGFFSLEGLLEATAEDIRALHGFGEITSQAIFEGLQKRRSTIDTMLALGFNLETTPIAQEAGPSDSPISDVSIVFTGKMRLGNRADMQARARKLGANVQMAVSGKTELLVCGENVGQSKIKKAQSAGTRILSEEEYYQLIEV